MIDLGEGIFVRFIYRLDTLPRISFISIVIIMFLQGEKTSVHIDKRERERKSNEKESSMESEALK